MHSNHEEVEDDVYWVIGFEFGSRDNCAFHVFYNVLKQSSKLSYICPTLHVDYVLTATISLELKIVKCLTRMTSGTVVKCL